MARPRTKGVSPGSDIYIHGQPKGISGRARIPGDWTAGATLSRMSASSRFYAMVQGGTPIFIHA